MDFSYLVLDVSLIIVKYWIESCTDVVAMQIVCYTLNARYNSRLFSRIMFERRHDIFMDQFAQRAPIKVTKFAGTFSASVHVLKYKSA